MKTSFPKKNSHIPNWYIIDASHKTLGRLSVEVCNILKGKNLSYFYPSVDQGNFVIIINANKINISGKKPIQKKYYISTQRPGHLKSFLFKDLKMKYPSRIIEQSIIGMLPKGVLGKKYFHKLFIYNTDQILYKNFK
jgi:large subunit ribosomal protein L13|uniref:Ribosomal protein L13 n=1 Tax=Poterioochromonas malhamensis TaxID=88167 RepID=A0A7T6Y7H2_9STRA|nr:ribosomal protein L13 [Poterioochromonas malhamensis]QQK54982.1 ribosomal protein L13 [Poterioochromonas malhamensis]